MKTWSVKHEASFLSVLRVGSGRAGFASNVPFMVCGGSATNSTLPPETHLIIKRQRALPHWEFLYGGGCLGRGFQRGRARRGEAGTLLVFCPSAGRGLILYLFLSDGILNELPLSL